MKRSLCTFLVLAVACASRADVIAVNPRSAPHLILSVPIK